MKSLNTNRFFRRKYAPSVVRTETRMFFSKSSFPRSGSGARCRYCQPTTAQSPPSRGKRHTVGKSAQVPTAPEIRIRWVFEPGKYPKVGGHLILHLYSVFQSRFSITRCFFFLGFTTPVKFRRILPSRHPIVVQIGPCVRVDRKT